MVDNPYENDKPDKDRACLWPRVVIHGENERGSYTSGTYETEH